MNAIVTAWRNFKYGRRCARLGRRCRFVGEHIQIDGNVEIGDFCRFRDYVIMRTSKEGRIVFGRQSGLSTSCIVESTCLVQFGDRTGVAEFTVIRDTTHVVRGTDANWEFTPRVAKPIIIGNDVWIGSRVYIGPGVTIGDGAVVGTGSVVTKNIGAYEVWAGAPARFLYHRIENVPLEVQAETDRLIAEQGIRPNRYEDR
ncbi:MAG TPA: acyltransferase [Candidatus Hydrogenedentes bacterium]|nr:acyltransferase [Candidatus Hydrogenedentota bacterium]HPG67019.1 acyltransferase [Candidatus Hydrogenedentota bacterium]